MPRTTRVRPTSRVQVNDTQDVGQFRVVATSPGAAGAGEVAKQLGSALGVTTDAVAQVGGQWATENAAKGRRDVALDQVSEEMERTHWGYRSAVTKARTEANWLADADEFDQRLRELDLSSVNPDQQAQVLNESIDELFKEKYQGLDDPDAAEVLLPMMEKFRAEKTLALQEAQVATRIEANSAALQTIARSRAEEARSAAIAENPGVPPELLTAGDRFDYLGLHAQVRAIKSGDSDTPGPATNEEYFAILKDLAIRTGDPGLIRNIPERWADGTPSIRSIPSFNDRILSAELQAENVRLAHITERDKAVADSQKAAIEGTFLQAIAAAANGDYAGAQTAYLAALGMPGADASDIAAIGNAVETMQNRGESRAGYEPAAAALTARVYMGSASQKDVLEAFNNGVFGAGEQATKRLAGLLNELQQGSGRNDANLNRVASGFHQAMARDYVPDPMFGKFDPTANEVLSQAQLEFNDRIYNQGQNPTEAYAAVREKFDKLIKNADSMKDTAKTYAGDPIAAATALAEGRLSWYRAQESGVTIETLKSLHASGRLTNERLAEILAAVSQ